MGLELDVLPAALYLRFKERIFPAAAFQDISPLIRRQRMVKSPYEIEQLRRAAAILDEAFAAVPEILRPGLTGHVTRCSRAANCSRWWPRVPCPCVSRATRG